MDFDFNVQNQSIPKSFRISDSTPFDKSPEEDKTFIDLSLIASPMARIISFRFFSLPELISLGSCSSDAAAVSIEDVREICICENDG